MAKKIFVSYKHSDTGVQKLNPSSYEQARARDYVDHLEQLFSGDHIYKGERDDDDLGHFKDETIESHLRDKIFDSSITIVLISKNMRESWKDDSDQWIPWEISYSLREKTREDRTSSSNAMLAVVLPDESGSYSYIVNHYPCVTMWSTNELFSILGSNMFNRNNKNLIRCTSCNGTHHTGQDHSYIHPVKWADFVSNINAYIDHAVAINGNIDHYDLVKMI